MSAAETLIEESPVAPVRENPFKFLDYYDENDRAIFAGRAEELTTILAELTLASTYVIYGRSGLGKTSIIKAGLFPTLTEIGYLPIYVRILDDPETDLCRAVAQALRRPEVAAEDLPVLLGNVPARDQDGASVTPVILVLDQFEEFFIRFREDAALRKRFTELLGEISREGAAAVRIIFSLREDYVAELNDLRPQLPDILVRSHRLLPLTAIGAREAILATLTAHHIEYDDTVPSLLVRELERHRFSPLVLQIYCSEVYEAAVKEDPKAIRLRARHVAAVGSVEAVYKRYLEAVTTGLSGDRVLVACCMLDILRTAEVTKRVLRVKDVGTDTTSKTPFPVYFNITCAEAESLLDALRDKRVVRRLPTEEAWYELLHDGIVPVLSDWLETKKEFRGFRDADRLVENVHTMEEAYLSEKLLRMAVDPYKHLLRLSPGEISFLFRSSVYEQSPSVAYWAKRFDAIEGGGAAERVIRGAIESPDQVIAGVVAAGCVKASSLAPLCLEKALHASQPAVRRAAGTAYAAIGAIDFAEIKSALHQSRVRRAAIDVLADLKIAGHALSPINSFTQRKANRVIEKRQVGPGAELIRNRVAIGTLAGFAGAMLVLVIMVLPVFYVAYSILNPTESDQMQTAIGQLAALLVIPSALIGCWMGRRALARAAPDAFLNRTERWSGRAATAWEIEFLTLLAAAWVSLVAPHGEEGRTLKGWTVLLLPGFVILAVMLARDTRRVVRAGWRLPEIEDRAAALRMASALGAVLIYILALRSHVAFPALALTATLLISQLMRPSMRFVERVLNPSTASLGKITVVVVGIGYLVGVLPLLLLFLVRGLAIKQPLALIVDDVTRILTIAAVAIAVRTSITAFALAWAQKQHPLSGEGIAPDERPVVSRWAPAMVTVGFLAPIAIWLSAFGANSIPLFASNEIAGSTISYHFSPNLLSTRYVKFVPDGDVTFVNGTVVTGLLSHAYDGGDLVYGITRKQPLTIALSNVVHRGSGNGTLQLKRIREGRGGIVRLSAVCHGNTLQVSGTGSDVSTPPEKWRQFSVLALFINGYAYEIENTHIGSKSHSAVSTIGSTPLTSSTPGSAWTIDYRFDDIQNRWLCDSPGVKGVAFAIPK
jgi:conflict system STAND superfamily ATPase